MNDITARKHGGNPNSVEAHSRVSPKKEVIREEIYRWARFASPFTMKDAARAFGKPPNEISPRLSELKKLRMIEETGDRRDGCGVLRVVERGKQMSLGF